jgi:hypothetical protein
VFRVVGLSSGMKSWESPTVAVPPALRLRRSSKDENRLLIAPADAKRIVGKDSSDREAVPGARLTDGILHDVSRKV